MPAGQYKTVGDDGYVGTKMADKYKSQKRAKTVERPEGNWGVVHTSNEAGEQPAHVVEAKLVEGDFAVNPKMVPFSTDPSKLLNGMVNLSLSPQQLYFIVGPEQFIWISAGNGSGKTKAGAVFVYMQIICNPNTLGLIAANSYAQLNQSTLKPLFEFLDEMGMPYVINRIPPAEWGLPRIFSDYDSIMVFPTGAHVLLRSLDRPANLEGLCFGAGTEIMAHDGRTILVEDLQIGDQLMGPEGLPRTVTKTSSGYGTLYKIQPEKSSEIFSKSLGLLGRAYIEGAGEEGPDKTEGPDKMRGGRIKTGSGFICNAEHILVLYHHPSGQTQNISLAEYLEMPDRDDYHYIYADGEHCPFHVEPIGAGPYHGLLISAPPGVPEDSQHRFLLADTTIVHNTIGWFWVDETRHTKPRTYNVIVNRLRCPHSTWRVGRVTSTPDGHNWLFKLFDKGMKNEATKLLYRIVFMSTRENIWLPKGFLDVLELQWDEMLAPQEIDGRIISLQVGRTYYAYSDVKNCKDRWPYDPRLPLKLCWDFNASVMPMACVLAQERYNERKGYAEVQVIDEFVKQYSNTEEICQLIIAKYGKHQGPWHIYGDSSKSTSSSKSDYETIRQFIEPIASSYIDYVTNQRNPDHLDRTSSVNGMLCNKRKIRRLFIHPRCKHLRDDMIRVKPDEKRKNKIDKSSDPWLTHPSDGLGYYIWKAFPALRQDVRTFAAPQTQLFIQ